MIENTFTLADNSSKPYAWMLENVDMADVKDAQVYVDNYARMSINATNSSDMNDADVYTAWREGSYEYEQAIAYVQSRINEYELEQVMTPAEIEEEYSLADGTVRQAINRESLSARKADDRTWLVHRNDAEKRWGNRKNHTTDDSN